MLNWSINSRFALLDRALCKFNVPYGLALWLVVPYRVWHAGCFGLLQKLAQAGTDKDGKLEAESTIQDCRKHRPKVEQETTRNDDTQQGMAQKLLTS